MDFKSLRANSSNSIGELTKKLSEMNTKASYADDRFWSPIRDKAGNAYAVIRFLPPAPDDELNFAKIYTHSFSENGKWYINNCPTTIGDKCPACDGNSELWNTGVDANKDIVRKRKRKLSYIVNIYVVTDKQEPENEGKNFLFKIGPKIFEKIQNAITPKFEDDVAFNPFDLWTGANFKLKIKNTVVNGQQMPSYDDSCFDAPKPLFDNDTVLEEIWKKEYKLSEFISNENFKPFDKLKERYDVVVGNTTTASKPTVKNETIKQNKFVKNDDTTSPIEPDDDVIIVADDVEDDDINYFKQLAEE